MYLSSCLSASCQCILFLYQVLHHDTIMSLPPSHPVSVLEAQPIPYTSSTSREVYLLWQRAETFRVELELESQLRLQGVGTLPPEWSAYLERERQLILDRLQRMEPKEDFTSLFSVTHDAHPISTLSPTTFSYEGVGVRHKRSVVASPTHGHNVSTRGLPHTVSPMRPEGGDRHFILPENEGTLAFALVLCHA
jgi:hypothetical protein